MIKVLSIFLLFIASITFFLNSTKGCEQRIEGPLRLSKEEFYEEFVEPQNVSREEVFESLEKSDNKVRFNSDRERKFFSQVARSDYIFVAAVLDYESEIWPTGVLPEILELPRVNTKWIVLETLMGKKEDVMQVNEQRIIDVYLQSGYLFHKASGKGAYELAVEYSGYLKGLLEKADGLYDRFSSQEISSRELRELEEVIKKDRSKIVYGNIYYPRRIATAFDKLNANSRLCDFNAIIPGEPYIITLDYTNETNQYRFAPGPSVFPMSYKDEFEKAIEVRIKTLR